MIIFKNENITVFQSAIFQMNSTIVATEDLVLVVDPGYLPQEVDEIRQYVNKIKGKRSVYLFFTHSDFDHIIGAGAFPEAKTIASREFVESPLKGKQIADCKIFDDDLYINRPYEIKYPNIDYMIKGNGEQLMIGETVIKFYHAFGHTNDGLFAVIESIHLLLAGDYLSNIEFPFVYYSYSEYRKTLERFRYVVVGKECLVLIPGHGNVTAQTSDIQKRINDAEDYLKLVNEEFSEEEFKQYLTEKQYGFITNLMKRHQENLKVCEDK